MTTRTRAIMLILAAALLLAPVGLAPMGFAAGSKPKAAPAPEAESFILNGGFETAKDGKAAHWGLHFWPRRKGIEEFIYVSEEKACTGKAALKIEARPPLKPKQALCFNGVVSKDVLKHQGKPLTLSGSVYMPAGSGALRVSLRVRMWGKNAEGKTLHLGDAVATYVTGKPGEWVAFKKNGIIPADKKVLSLDLHCNGRTPDAKAVIYIDDVLLTVAEEKAAD